MQYYGMIKPNTDCFKGKDGFYSAKHEKFWKLLYYHDYSKVGKWKNLSEPLLSYNADKYSILSTLNYRYKIQGSYEFLLEYPDIVGYNQWTQTSNPLEEQETNSDGSRNAEGYKAISLTWSGNYFGGLVKSTNQYSLLDGSTYISDWWYAIGSNYDYQGGVPGPNNKVITKSQLWIRVKNSPFMRYCSNKYKTRSLLLNMQLFIIVIIK